MSILFSPLKIKEVELKNRLTVSPMCQYSSEDGFSNNWHLVHLGSRAVGGAGLIITEATAVSPEARITPSDLGIWKDEHIDGLKNIVDFGASRGAVMGIQLAHAGRKASTSSPWEGGKYLQEDESGWQTVSASAIPFNKNDNLPQELDREGIQKVIGDFKAASERAVKAGFQVVEIHAAHGYLLHQFLSPLSNNRNDKYGGSFENRIRLLLEVTEAVKQEWPEDLPLFVRISATDWAEGGWNEEESVKLAPILQKKGVDLIDCSSGGLVPGAKIPVAKGYQVQFAEKIKREAGIMTGAVGLITTPEEAEEILTKEKADLILIGREFLRDPYFPLEAAKALGEEISWPSQYQRAKPSMHILGLGTNDSGIWLSSDLFSFFHPADSVKTQTYINAAGIKNEEEGDREYLQQLITSVNFFPKSGQFCVLAIDKCYTIDGEWDKTNSKLFIPNEWVVKFCEENKEKFIPCISVNPYRDDAVKELERYALRGVKMVKWMPLMKNVSHSTAR